MAPDLVLDQDRVLGMAPEQVLKMAPDRVLGMSPEQVLKRTPDQVPGMAPDGPLSGWKVSNGKLFLPK